MLATPFFHRYMSRNTMQLLMSALHFNNDSANPQHGEPGHDPLAKLRPILNTVQAQFRTQYSPLKNIGLDEAGCKFHGQCKFRVFNPNKPDKYHIKLYAIAESDSGYVCGFEVYSGAGFLETISKRWQSTTQDLTFGKCILQHKRYTNIDIVSLVMQMLQKYNFLDRGHVLYTDNYYTSVHLAEELVSRSTMLVGTIKEGRIGFPKALKNAKNATKPTQKNPAAQLGMKPHGQEVCWRRSKDGKLLAMVYADRKKVCLLSTIHKADERQLRRTYNKKRSKVIWRPACVDDYNKGMKAVDLADEQMRNYELHRRSLSWPRKLFFHLLNMCLTNAYLLYKKATHGEKNQLSHVLFRAEVATSLIVQGIPSCNYRPPIHSTPLVPDELRFQERHFPDPIPVLPSAPGERKKREHRKCNLCRQKNTKVMCRPCQKYLCAWPCFKVYHTPNLSIAEERENHQRHVHALKGPNQNVTLDESETNVTLDESETEIFGEAAHMFDD